MWQKRIFTKNMIKEYLFNKYFLPTKVGYQVDVGGIKGWCQRIAWTKEVAKRKYNINVFETIGSVLCGMDANGSKTHLDFRLVMAIIFTRIVY